MKKTIKVEPNDLFSIEIEGNSYIIEFEDFKLLVDLHRKTPEEVLSEPQPVTTDENLIAEQGQQEEQALAASTTNPDQKTGQHIQEALKSIDICSAHDWNGKFVGFHVIARSAGRRFLLRKSGEWDAIGRVEGYPVQFQTYEQANSASAPYYLAWKWINSIMQLSRLLDQKG